MITVASTIHFAALNAELRFTLSVIMFSSIPCYFIGERNKAMQCCYMSVLREKGFRGAKFLCK